MGAAKLTVKFVYRVLAMKNGDEIQPEFTFWFAGNGVPGGNTAVGSFSGADYQIVCQDPASCANHNNIEPYHISGRKTTVSCYPFMNLKLMGGNSTLDKVLQKWDFSSGSADAQSRVAVNGSTYNETVTGRSTSFAAAVMLCSPTGNGLRGVELPDTGNITFDLQLSSVFLNNNNQNITTTGYSPLLWSVEGNAANKAVGSAHVHNSDGRWVPSGLTYVNYNAPYNKRSTSPGYDSCYDGGTWTATQEITSGGSVLHVTVSDYVFNKEHLPYRGSTNSGNVYYDPAIVEDRYWEVDNAVFSVGEFWLVQPTYNINDPSVSIVSDENTDSAQIRTTARVKNGAINAPVGETVVTAQTLTTDDTYNVSLEVRDKAGSIG